MEKKLKYAMAKLELSSLTVCPKVNISRSLFKGNLQVLAIVTN